MELREADRVFEGKHELKVIDLHQLLINKLCKELGYAIRNNTPVDIPAQTQPNIAQMAASLSQMKPVKELHSNISEDYPDDDLLEATIHDTY
jgi:hypothetical protein